MTELTAESIFGVKAGTVWNAFNENGPSLVKDSARITALKHEMIYGALGWLGRENKILIEQGEEL